MWIIGKSARLYPADISRFNAMYNMQNYKLPINTVLYDVQTLTCEAKLFFNSTEIYSPCNRQLVLHYSTPTLHRQATLWVYHFPIGQQVTIRYPKGNDWRIYNAVLSETGVIHNAMVCSTAYNAFRTLPELHGSGYTRLDTPSLDLPDVSPMLEVHEIPQLQEAFPTEARELENFKTRLQTPQRSSDLDILLQLRLTSSLRESKPYWHLIITTASCMLTKTYFLYCFPRPPIRHSLLCNVTIDEPSYTNPVPPTTSTPTTVPGHLEDAKQEDYHKEMVSFSTYSSPQTMK